MTLRHTTSRAILPLFGWLLASAFLFPTGIARAAEPLDVDQRQTLTQALADLTASRHSIAMLVSECDGGMVNVIACTAPKPGGRGAAGCDPTDRWCTLAAAMHDTDAAIAELNKVLATAPSGRPVRPGNGR